MVCNPCILNNSSLITSSPAQIFDAKTEDVVASARANARKPADHAYASAKVYQDAVSARLHDTLVQSQQTLGGFQERLGLAAAKVPKSTAEAQQVATHLLEHLEALKNTLVKQSHELVSRFCQYWSETDADTLLDSMQPAHLSKAVEPYIAKLQKGAGEVKNEVGIDFVPQCFNANSQFITARQEGRSRTRQSTAHHCHHP